MTKKKRKKKAKKKELIPKYAIINAMRKMHRYSQEYKQAKEKAKVDSSLYECTVCSDLYYNGQSEKNFQKYKEKYYPRKVYRGSLDLDHTIPVVCPEKGYQGLDEYAKRLFCKSELLTPMCKDCHKKVTEEENKVRKKKEKIMKLALKSLKIVCSSIFLAFTLICLQPQMLNKVYHYYVGSNVFKIQDFLTGGSGTGFYIVAPSGNKYIMTNNHVCNMSTGLLYAKHQHSGNSYVVTVAHQSKEHDLCILKTNERLPFYVRGLRVAHKVNTGDIMTVVGHPSGNPLTVSRGEIIGQEYIQLILGFNLKDKQCFGKNLDVETTTELTDQQKLFLTLQGIKKVCIVRPLSAMNTSITFPGNSGSPAVNHNFRVTGVLFAGIPNQPTKSYVVPLKYIKSFLKDK